MSFLYTQLNILCITTYFIIICVKFYYYYFKLKFYSDFEEMYEFQYPKQLSIKYILT